MAQLLPARQVSYLRRPRPLVFPSEATMPESKAHLDLRTALYLVLRAAFRDVMWIGSDQFVYYDAADPARAVAPDIFVRRGGPDEQFASWKTWERGAPELAIEIISENDSSQGAWEKKLARYHSVGVEELVRFEPGAAVPLRVWDRVSNDLVEREVDGDSAPSRVLGLDFLIRGDQLRLAKDADLLPTPDERADFESARAGAAAEHALAEAARAGAEAVRAGEEAARAARLRAQLLAAGIDPDD